MLVHSLPSKRLSERRQQVVLVALRDELDLAGFDCGNDEMNQWLTRHSRASHKADLARTWIALDGNAVAGYSDAAAARVVVADAIDVRVIRFYKRWGFVDTPDNPTRLYRKISVIRASLPEPTTRATDG